MITFLALINSDDLTLNKALSTVSRNVVGVGKTFLKGIGML